jgi:hypothetical protein
LTSAFIFIPATGRECGTRTATVWKTTTPWRLERAAFLGTIPLGGTKTNQTTTKIGVSVAERVKETEHPKVCALLVLLLSGEKKEKKKKKPNTRSSPHPSSCPRKLLPMLSFRIIIKPPIPTWQP